MDRGEAFFSVAHDPERPFVVTTSDGTITVLGTRFNVRQEAERMIVSVIEGRVEVVPTAPRAPATTLVRGEQLFLERGTDSSVERGTDVERITAWWQQKLMFDGVSLIDAVQEINRYVDERIEIADPGLEGVRISGVFRTGDSEGFISALDNLVGVNAVTGSDEVIRLYAAGEQ
jgi:transmembrane sensor